MNKGKRMNGNQENQAMVMNEKEVEAQCRQFREMFEALRREVGKVIVGHQEIVDNVLISLFSGGHVLLEGVPGLGKTLLVRTLSSAFSLEFRRIQFTPDLMPADIVGTNIVMEDHATGRREFQFQKGPIFGQIILADEINRATPKTQSAMLEAMQEHSVTSGGQVRKLQETFMVLATQNPIEQEGTYPLPEAQLDRFFFKLLVGYSNREQLKTILDRTTTGQEPRVESVANAEKILWAQRLVKHVVVAEHVQDYAIRLVLATHPEGEFATEMVNRFVRFGSSPRGVQALALAGKVRALLNERYHVSFDDIAQSVLPALRHRLLLNFEGQAEGTSTDDVLKDVIGNVPRTAEQKAVP
jgi:MoxR-like ATPase